MTKATTAAGDQRRYGPNWLLSRRSTLRVFDDHLECGDWSVEYTTIHAATLFSFRSALGFPGYILTIEALDRTYHFGLNGWGKFWKGELPFPVRRERGRLAYSWFSALIRLLLIGYVLYLAYQWATS